MKPTIKDLQEKLASLGARHAVLQGANERNIKEIKRLKGSPTVQQKLNMANKTVHDLMQELDELNQRLTDTNAEKMKYFNRYNEIAAIHENIFDKANALEAENHALKAEIERTNRHINLAEKTIADYEQKTGKLNNHYCQPEMQRGEYRAATDTLTVEQQPLVVNHYHNCVINK